MGGERAAAAPEQERREEERERERERERRSRWLLKIALSFSASIDAGVVVVVCSVMSKRHDGAGIIYFEGRGVVLSFWGPRLREFVTARTSYGRTRGAPRQTLTRTTAETEIDDFCLDRPPRRAREVSERALLFLFFFFCLSALKSFRVDDAEGTQLERRKEGRKGRARPTPFATNATIKRLLFASLKTPLNMKAQDHRPHSSIIIAGRERDMCRF